MKDNLSTYESIFFTGENGLTVNKGFAVRFLLISFNTCKPISRPPIGGSEITPPKTLKNTGQKRTWAP
jgi:hypothetical protein